MAGTKRDLAYNPLFIRCVQCEGWTPLAPNGLCPNCDGAKHLAECPDCGAEVASNTRRMQAMYEAGGMSLDGEVTNA